MHSVKYVNEVNEIAVGKIVCVGRNYAEHARELGNEVPPFPIVFLKPASCIIPSGGAVEYPSYSNELHHEVELVLLIGKTARKCSVSEAEDCIEGYAVGLDMTLRDLQRQYMKDGGPWTFAKCFDTSAVLSEFVKKQPGMNILNEKILFAVNGVVRQQEILSAMVFKPADIVSYISHRLTLEPGDLVFTGTPKGVSAVERGDALTAEIGSICRLESRVI